MTRAQIRGHLDGLAGYLLASRCPWPCACGTARDRCQHWRPSQDWGDCVRALMLSPDWCSPVCPADDLHLRTARYSIPDGFTPHPDVAKIMKERGKMVERGKHINWGCAEALAFASLLSDGHHVRLTGQDSERGTFSHRHAVLHDQVRRPTGVEHGAVVHSHRCTTRCGLHRQTARSMCPCSS